MKKKNTLLGVALLIAVLMLGVGYAITSITLKVNGTATAQESATSFKVEFTGAEAGAETTDDAGNTLTSAAANIGNGTTATMEVTLTNVEDTQTATFEVSNLSQAGLSAKITATNVKIYEEDGTTPFASDYFDVTTDIADVTIPSVTNNTTEFTVTVKLKKAFISDEDETTTTEKFVIALEGIEAVEEN